MKRISAFVSVTCIFMLAVGCSTASNEKAKTEVTISAASSLGEALQEIEEVYEKEHDVDLLFNFAASGTLSKQIEQGAPVDLFFSADQQYLDKLISKDLIKKEHSSPLLRNELVLIAPFDSKIIGIKDLLNAEKIAIGLPEIVPAGQYAKEALIELDLWEDIEKNIIYTKDVRQVLSYVETGNVSVGLVYKTDISKSSSKVKNIAAIDFSLHSPIVYPIGVIQKSDQKEEALLFYHFLHSKKAISIFKKYGFAAVD